MDIGHSESLNELKAKLEKKDTGSWELWGVQSKACNKHPITFAITRHKDGWEYYYINNTTGDREDGVYDDPNATAHEATCNLLESFGFFLTGTGKKLDYEAVVAKYEEKIE